MVSVSKRPSSFLRPRRNNNKAPSRPFKRSGAVSTSASRIIAAVSRLNRFRDKFSELSCFGQVGRHSEREWLRSQATNRWKYTRQRLGTPVAVHFRKLPIDRERASRFAPRDEYWISKASRICCRKGWAEREEQVLLVCVFFLVLDNVALVYNDWNFSWNYARRIYVFVYCYYCCYCRTAWLDNLWCFCGTRFF